MINQKALLNKKAKLTEEEKTIRLDNFTNMIIEFSKSNGEVFAISEEDAIYVNDDSIELLGTKPYFIFKNGIMTKRIPSLDEESKKIL